MIHCLDTICGAEYAPEDVDTQAIAIPGMKVNNRRNALRQQREPRRDSRPTKPDLDEIFSSVDCLSLSRGGVVKK